MPRRFALLLSLVGLANFMAAPARPAHAQARLVAPADSLARDLAPALKAAVLESTFGATEAHLAAFAATLPADASVRWLAALEASSAAMAAAPAPDGTRFTLYRSAPGHPASAVHTLDVPPDTPAPHPALLVDGSIALAHPAVGDVTFVRPDGSPRTVSLFKEAPYTLERTVLQAPSAEGGLLIATAAHPARPGATAARTEARLFYFAADGTLAWQTPLSLPAPYALRADPAGRYIAVASVDPFAAGGPRFATQVLTPEGQVVRDVPYRFDHAAFAEAQPRVLLLTKRDALWLDLDTGTVAARGVAPPPGAIWVDAVTSPDGRQAALLSSAVGFDQGFVYDGARLHLMALDADGTVRSLARSGPALMQQRLALQRHADRIAVVRDRDVLLFSWPPSDR